MISLESGGVKLIFLRLRKVLVSSDEGGFLVSMDKGSKDRERLETVIPTSVQNERCPKKKLLSWIQK